jgi:hypothetical protein
MAYREGDHIRDKITHRVGEIEQVYHDGWLLVCWADGETDHAEPRDLEPDPAEDRYPSGGGDPRR